MAIVADGSNGIIRVNGIPIDLTYGSWLGEYYEGAKIQLDSSEYAGFNNWIVSIEGKEKSFETPDIVIEVPIEGVTIRVE